MLYMFTIYTFVFIVKLVNLLFVVCFATGYIHSGEIQIFTSDRVRVSTTHNTISSTVDRVKLPCFDS